MLITIAKDMSHNTVPSPQLFSFLAACVVLSRLSQPQQGEDNFTTTLLCKENQKADEVHTELQAAGVQRQ